MSDFIELIKNRRSIRWFLQKPVEYDKLVEMVDCARVAPYGANIQPLKYKIINDSETVAKIYPHTSWAGYIPDRKPSANDAPTAFVAIFGDKTLKKDFGCDCGIAGMSMILAAESMGLSTCWIGAFDKENVLEILGTGENLELCYLIAVGYAGQKSDICPFDGDIKYTMDDDGNMHVPKRPMDEVLIK